MISAILPLVFIIFVFVIVLKNKKRSELKECDDSNILQDKRYEFTDPVSDPAYYFLENNIYHH